MYTINCRRYTSKPQKNEKAAGSLSKNLLPQKPNTNNGQGIQMEFNEKLQQLRKNNNLTQEQLAEQLYVSRTAISKWESGRGYPNIESLKCISKLFSVTIDELLSSDKQITLAENENRSNLKKIYMIISAIVDVIYVAFI